MAWLALIISGALETVWASALKLSDGFTKPLPTLTFAVSAFIGMWLLAYAMKAIPLGTAYPVWVGIGAIGAFAVGALWMGEAVTLLRLVSIALILAGILGLHLSARGGA